MKTEETFVTRKSTRTSTPPKRRVKHTISPPSKRRTLQISSSESKEEIGYRHVEVANQEANTLVGRKAWKPKVENLNMQIVNHNNFVRLNKYYDFYNNMDRRQLENVVVRNMILKDKRFDTIKG